MLLKKRKSGKRRREIRPLNLILGIVVGWAGITEHDLGRKSLFEGRTPKKKKTKRGEIEEGPR